jgi:hypothetical protein
MDGEDGKVRRGEEMMGTARSQRLLRSIHLR